MLSINKLQFIAVKTTAMFAQVLQIREEVFIKEQTIEPHFEFTKDNYLFQHFVVQYEDEIIATARVCIKQDVIYFSRIAVRKKYRSQNVGTFLLQHLEQVGKNTNCCKVILDAQSVVVPFYLKNGYITVGSPQEKAGILHITMEKPI